MSTHLLHVVISWALSLGVFGAMGVAAALRHRAAAARLRQLDPRAKDGA
ncbi:hypothetical protein [Falsiroseomonas sp. CW058]